MSNQEENQFSGYQLSEEILEALRLLGYQKPSKIQQAVIPIMLSGGNVVAKSPTGSGKTAAFAVPVCEKITWEENLPQALILEPARELAVQVREESFFIGRKKRLKAVAVFGGFPIDKQMQSLKQKSHIVVGTPGRVMDLVRRGSLKLDKVAWLVIDEADLMLDMGFIEEIKTLLSLVPPKCSVSLFSATLKPQIRQLVEEFIKDAALIMQEPLKEEVPAISQYLYETDSEHKYANFTDSIKRENPESCIIFCGTREMVDVLFQKMRRNRMFCGRLHGEMDQKERLKTVDAFRRGCFRFLIATDVAARGIDFDNITHVIQYDFPTGRETYVHRIGRTGRNGRKGTAISLVCEEDRRMLSMIEEFTGQALAVSPCPQLTEQEEKQFWKSQHTKAEAKPEKGDALNRDILRLSIGSGKKSKIRTGDIVGAICSLEGVNAEDIGIIDIRESLSYVEILNQKGRLVLDYLQTRPIKGKIRKARATKTVS